MNSISYEYNIIKNSIERKFGEILSSLIFTDDLVRETLNYLDTRELSELINKVQGENYKISEFTSYSYDEFIKFLQTVEKDSKYVVYGEANTVSYQQWGDKIESIIGEFNTLQNDQLEFIINSSYKIVQDYLRQNEEDLIFVQECEEMNPGFLNLIKKQSEIYFQKIIKSYNDCLAYLNKQIEFNQDNFYQIVARVNV